ncbi:RNA polymerase sigma factor [Chryseobacterium sp. NRRL B-14859]|uniref:RNA polymerase sigma factor n=1 Tax=Chryseobacterium sp. NRRL B-14859 TaxID=1562763 RepID=UPI003397212B
MISLEQEFLSKIERHKAIIYKISKMYMSEKDDRDDLFQEITYQLWKAYPGFKGQSEFSTWLYRIALNTAIIFLKSQKRRSFIANEDVSNYIIVQEEYDQQKEEKLTTMYKAIHQLNPIDKAFIFFYLEDFSGKEIAEQMGISEGNARVKMNRAKNKLKEILDPNMINNP